MIDHLGVQVTDVDAPLAWYLRALGPVGLREAMRFPVEGGFVVGLSGRDGAPGFWLSPARREQDRELHVAFAAASRAEVDAVHQAAASGGAEVHEPALSGPAAARDPAAHRVRDHLRRRLGLAAGDTRDD